MTLSDTPPGREKTVLDQSAEIEQLRDAVRKHFDSWAEADYANYKLMIEIEQLRTALAANSKTNFVAWIEDGE